MPDKPSNVKGGVEMVSSSRPIVISSDAYMQSLERIARLGQRVKEEKFDPKKHKDTKRAHIAMVFVYGYMITVAIVIVLAPLFNALFTDSKEPLDVERILAQVGSLIGAPLGFVIGYYFKEDK
jgi:membrane protein YqaA with SNARE-associated domain